MNGPFLQFLSFAIALIGALGCGQLSWMFWNIHRERALGCAFAVFFLILAVAFVWIATIDVLAMFGYPVARGIWTLIFRSALTAAVWYVLFRMKRGDD